MEKSNLAVSNAKITLYFSKGFPFFTAQVSTVEEKKIQPTTSSLCNLE